MIPIVNGSDKIITHKERVNINYKEDIFRTASLWITNSRSQVLLAQRKIDKKVDPGKWGEAVGGTVESGDSYEETILREAYEELGIEKLNFHIGPKQYVAVPCKYFVQWYRTTIDTPIESFVLQPEEVEQIAWIDLEKLQKELQVTPEKYIGAMPEIIQLLYEGSAK